MGKLIAFIIVLVLGYYVYTGVLNPQAAVENGLNKAADGVVETMKKEKTVRAINGRRAREQEDINRVLNNEI